MKEKKAFLITLTVVVEVDDTPEDGMSELDRLQNRLIDVVAEVSGLHPPLGWQTSWTTELDPLTTNCGQCTVCKSWVTDRESPEPIEGLDNGARVEGQLLCSEHLPPGHPYAF
jgi:hypothetical protein